MNELMWGQPPSAVHRAKPGFCFVSGHPFRHAITSVIQSEA
jgi:hypothetical protein